MDLLTILVSCVNDHGCYGGPVRFRQYTHIDSFSSLQLACGNVAKSVKVSEREILSARTILFGMSVSDSVYRTFVRE